MLDRIAITQGDAVLALVRNAKAITLPGGATVMGPLKTLPHAAGDYTIRAVDVDGPYSGPLEIGGTAPPVVEGDVVVIRRTVAAMGAEQAEAVLAARKLAAKAQVDAAAEAARLRYVTPGSAQAMVYQQKAAEARDLVAGGAGPWPHLEAEVGITAKLDGTPTTAAAEVAEVVLAMEAQWRAVSAQIEAARLAAKRDIAAAADLAAVDAVLAALAWPEPQTAAEVDG